MHTYTNTHARIYIRTRTQIVSFPSQALIFSFCLIFFCGSLSLFLSMYDHLGSIVYSVLQYTRLVFPRRLIVHVANMFTHTHTHTTHTHAHTHTHTRTHTYSLIYTYTHEHTRTHSRSHTHDTTAPHVDAWDMIYSHVQRHGYVFHDLIYTCVGTMCCSVLQCVS